MIECLDSPVHAYGMLSCSCTYVLPGPVACITIACYKGLAPQQMQLPALLREGR